MVTGIKIHYLKSKKLHKIYIIKVCEIMKEHIVKTDNLHDRISKRK